ncbi:MAG: UbiD family decarboxylase domain-containing protein, partial [Candidatus Binatia bacterium]
GLRGRPFDVLLGEVTRLPFPAHAEIAIEGFMHPGETKPEGPFGEWLGYYGNRTEDTPVVRVEKVYYRNDPILCCARPGRPPTDYSLAKCVYLAATIWDHVEKAGLPNVKGVWCSEPGIGRFFNVIAIKQAYPGHARQALFLASQVLGGAYIGRFVVVVDDDIDPTNIFDVIWAMATRCDPEKSIEIIRRCWTGALDVVIPRESKGHSSRALIDACKPYERRGEFPPVAESSEELKAQVREKWKEAIHG